MNSLENNFEKFEICRLCLNLTTNKISVFKDDFSKMIEILTCLKVKTDDKLPKISCLKCARDVKTAFLVRRRIIQSYQLLNGKISRYSASNRARSNHRESNSNNNSNSFHIAQEVEIKSNSEIDTQCKEKVHKPETGTLNEIEEQICEESKKNEIEESKTHTESENSNFLGFESKKKVQKIEIKSHIHVLQSKPRINSWKMMNKNDQLHIIKWRERKKVNSKNLTSRLASSVSKKKEPLNMYCAHCEIKFTNRISFKNHMTKHKHKTCPICDKQIRSTYLKRHMSLHEEAPVICEICGQTCKNACSLRMHFFYYHKNPNFCVCEDCGRSFRTKTKLLYHQRKDHTKERNYKCETCGKTFFLKIYLTKHINMKHMKLRPHICEYCGKGFSGRHALRTHVRQHTNEAPYHCTLCGERFRQRVSLRGHLKSRHNVEEEHSVFCEVCGKGFVSEIALDVHSRLHSEIKCLLCTDTFADKFYLGQHMSTVHTTVQDSVVDGEFEWTNL